MFGEDVCTERGAGCPGISTGLGPQRPTNQASVIHRPGPLLILVYTSYYYGALPLRGSSRHPRTPGVSAAGQSDSRPCCSPGPVAALSQSGSPTLRDQTPNTHPESASVQTGETTTEAAASPGRRNLHLLLAKRTKPLRAGSGPTFTQHNGVPDP